MERKRLGNSTRPWAQDNKFIDLVFSWSARDICDENLYKNQVEDIPESFQNVDTYLGSYFFPLLEETRAELASAMETVYNAPFAVISYFKELKHGEMVYSVKVDGWSNRKRVRGTEAYKTLPGDIVLLSNTKPETASDLERFGWTYTFGCVKSIPDDDSFDDGFTLRSAEPIDVEYKRMDMRYVVFLMNVKTQERIWTALGMRRNLTIIQKVISKDELDEEECQICPHEFNTKIEEHLEQINSSKLNESQLEAILACLSKIDCSHKSPVELIWGPPGTGKTSTLSTLLYTLLRMNVRTLVCAPSNVAITELASRVVKQVRKSFESDNGSLSCHLGNMLIFGNKDRLKVGSDIQEIFLDHRVDRLTECLLSCTGWKSCVSGMLDFLEDCVSQYQIFIENEQINANKNVEDDVRQNFESKSLLEFARDRLRHLATPLRECMMTFSTHLPRSSANEPTFKNIKQLMFHLDSIEILLFEDSRMTSNELESVFQQKGMVGSESFVDKLSLHHVRSQCMSILRSLQFSLDRLGLPTVIGKDSITEFCFRKASLIFCTTSSAFKLHFVEMEPFRLLVIDEAAQVKECESIIALQIPDVRRAILVGDERQLPSTVNSKLSEGAGYGRSLFERLSLLGHSKRLLNVQYRMHPSISRFPNSTFYLDKILDAPSVQCESYERRYLQGSMFGPYSFMNIRGGKEEFDEVGHSRKNMVEVAVVVKLVHKLYKAWNGSNESLSIGLISPYAAQVSAIRDRLQKKYENIEGFVVKVKSVDGFQGGEEDVIIISTVRCGGSIGFLSSSQRTNVSLTRARHALWILGNERTLSRSNSVWEALVFDAKRRQCLFNADEDHEIRQSIIHVKKELQQLDNLVTGDSVLFKNSRWKVLFSDNFRKSFQRLKPSNIKKLAINVLLKLASGWRPKKINVDWPCENSSYILKQFKFENYYVVCSIDVIKDSNYFQVLKVWDVLVTEETPKLLKRLDSIVSMYTDDYINHCNTKSLEGNLEVPKSWPGSKEIIKFKNFNNTELDASASAVDCRSYVENSKVNESLLLMKFYSLSSGIVNHLLTDLEGREVDLPFEVTDEEREIIMFSRSSFILGRSGTGKTTVLTMKLYQKLQQYCAAADSSSRVSSGVDLSESSGVVTLRQLFVTVSPKLCYAVKKHVTHLKSFASGIFVGNNFTDMEDVDELAEFKDIPDTFVGIPPEKYPLIITFHKFLMMLDGTLGKSYFERFRDARGSSQYDGGRSVALQTFIRKNEVTYDRFRNLYWPHFNEKLTKNLDPSRVFTEIMSHIKGGLQEEDEAYRSKRTRHEYVSLSDCRASTLTAVKRELVYDIFEYYEKMKLERGEYDLADFVNDIRLRLNDENFRGDKMDFVYIDEVQDLSMRQISLFRYICENVDEGFVFSGDTAQTIARGIDFRFEDIRSLFYNEFFMKSRDCEYRGRREKGLVSDMFCLSQNFRTHTGVLRLAHSVVNVISHFFPNSIDMLPPETSLIYGESPVVLEPGSDENLIMSIFGHSANAGRNWVGFGADQVVLVRDDSARDEIYGYIGRQALVLTIVECKGLEFQDVLLYNFFGSSPLSNQWRVLYEFLKEKDLLDANSPSFPSFSQSKHNILCSELKQLYVAITRTRQRLWICENNEELSKPMLDYWRRLCLVQVRKVDDSLAQAMQRASSPDEWKSQGVKLFWEENYEMATLCFEKAGDETWEKRAKASGLRASSDTLRGSNPEEARVRLREAAEIFDSIGRYESAAECFCDLGEYERAGNIYLKKCGTSELRKAGECFSLAGRYKIAAEVYAKGNFFDECLSACTEGNCFDMGLQYIEQWKQQASPSSGSMIDKIAQEFLEKIASECHRKKDDASLMKFVRAFDTMESKRKFLKSLDRLEELLIFEEESGNFYEAAEIAMGLGDILREVDLLEKAGDFTTSSSLILSYVLSNSLWSTESRGWPLKSFPHDEELLTKAMSVARKVDDFFYSSVRAEADAITTREQKSLSELMRRYNATMRHKSYTGEILSVRKLLDAHFQEQPAKYEWDLELHADPRRFDEIILRNRVSCGTLVYFWNLWEAKISEVLGRLDLCLDGLDLDGCEDAVRFCFKYFGVRLLKNSSVGCMLLNPDAAWVGNVIDKRFVVRSRKAATLDARHFTSAVQKYWKQELVAVGLRVLVALQELHKFSVMKPLSRYDQGVCLTSIYEVARFFIGSSSLDLKKVDEHKFREFLRLSSGYFDIAFPLDSRQSLSENLISLRKTEISKDLLGEIISKNISLRNELTYGQIGRAVMIMMGSGKPRIDLYEPEKFESWKPFVENLNGFIESDSGREMHRALEESFYARWHANDCMSPNCFLYIVERLLILVPHPRGFFFTTKSSFVEHLMCLQSDTNPSSCFFTDGSFYFRDIFAFLFGVIQQCLYNDRETAGWIKNSRIDCGYYLRVMILRLFVILCCLCLNLDYSCNVPIHMIDIPRIRSRLPVEFCEALLRIKNNNRRSFVSVISEAFETIGDPLVIVSSSGSRPNVSCPDSFFLDTSSFSCRDEILEVLLPTNTTTLCDQSTSVERHATESSGIEVHRDVENQVESTTLESTKENDTNLSSDNAEGELQVKHGFNGEIPESMESLKKENNGEMESLVLRKKGEIEEYVKFLTSVVSDNRRSLVGVEDEDEDDLCEGASFIDELNQMCSLLDMWDVNSLAASMIGEILIKFEERRPQLDALLSRLTLLEEVNAESVVSEETNDFKEDKECEDLAVAGKNPSNKKGGAECSQTQGKGKSKKNKKKTNRKGGKGGRKK